MIEVLRIMFGTWGEEVRRRWRKLHNEVHNLYSWINIIKM
jgi:hypothetical protein